MGDDPANEDEEDLAREMVAAAEQHFRGVMRALVDIRRQLEAGDTGMPESEVRRALVGVHRAVQVVFDERKKLDEIRRSHSGTACTHAVDLRQAEEEVRGRLDRLRAAFHGDEVP